MEKDNILPSWNNTITNYSCLGTRTVLSEFLIFMLSLQITSHHLKKSKNIMIGVKAIFLSALLKLKKMVILINFIFTPRYLSPT